MQFILLYISVLCSYSSVDHAIYISVTNINLNASESEIEVAMKVFSDDLEDAIHNHSGRREKIVGREEFAPIVDKIESYVSEKMRIQIDNNQISLKVTSCENIGDTTWIHLLGQADSFSGTFNINNSILFEIFDTQTNVVEVSYEGEKYYWRLSKNTPETNLDL